MTRDFRNIRTTVRATVIGRYRLPGVSRALYARHLDGYTYITDEPLIGGDESYDVDALPDHEGPAAIDALVRDYLAQAATLGGVPMATCELTVDLLRAA